MSKMNETIQLINSAIIKSRELDLKTDLQARMTKIAESDEMEAFDAAISEFAKKQKVWGIRSSILTMNTQINMWDLNNCNSIFS